MTPETNNTVVMPTKVISKMSVKTLGCNAKAAAAKDDNDDTPVRLCQIYGRADGTKSGEGGPDGGIWTALTGNFEGVNLKTGEKFQSGKVFLPGGIQETIQSPLMKIKESDSNASIEFAFEIRAVRASNPVGYSYQAVPLLAPTEKDLFSDLRSQVTARTEQLNQIESGNAPAQIAAPAGPAATQEPAAAPKPAARRR